jgi:2-polyprenyl-3-methyl-5-hydroxy-6-metoxy-1,4-benzoquinol methylase
VFIPTLHPDRGFGHLARCVRWAQDRPKSFVFLHDQWGADRVRAAREAFPDYPFFLEDQKRLPTTAIGILDAYRTSVAEFEPWKRKFKLWIAVDEGGSLRSEIPYLLDTLPNDSLIMPNAKIPALIQRYPKRSLPAVKLSKILVSFGGADPFGLSEKFIASGIWEKDGRDYTLALGPQVKRPVLIPEALSCVKNTGSLDELIADHDAVLCSFGLTAYEALTQGKPVFLVNGSPYHNQLAGMEDFNWGSWAEAEEFFASWPHQEPSRVRLEKVWDRLPHKPMEWEDLLDQGEWSDWSCASCSSREGEVLFRQEKRTFFSCQRCGMINQMVFGAEKKSYGSDYFFDEYQAQYGRTYLEDFQHIKTLGTQRLQKLRPLVPPGGKILEIGCAYGPFLQAAKEAGYDALGTDINPEAIQHITHELGLKAVRGDFLELPLEQLGGAESYDAVVLWYVIEHFPRVFRLLDKIKRLLKPRGILAFSTPNALGATGRWDPGRFFTSSPLDHYTLWSPKNSARVLERFGFSLRTMRHTGIHPQRIPWAKSSLLRNIMGALAPIFGWGDTFEVYARLEH